MFRFRLKRLCIALALLFVVVIIFRSNNRLENNERNVLDRMNVYDKFLQLNEDREKLIEKQLEKSKVVRQMSNDLQENHHVHHVDKVAESFKKRKVVDYSKYTDVLSMKPPKFLPSYKNPCWEWHIDNSTKVRCLPFFHLVGVDKCGTTDLWARIVQHPQLIRNGGILGKETHWWSWRRFGFDIWVENKTPWTFEDYLRVFDTAAKQIAITAVKEKAYEDDFHPLITGEGSPTVFWDFTGWDRMPQNEDKTADTALLTPHAIKHLTPKALFILLLRNPTERLYSDYMFLDIYRPKHNISAENFHHGVVKSISMFRECKKTNTLKGCLYDKQLHMDIPVRIFVGMYVVYLKEWFNVFNKDQFLIFKNEEYSKDVRGHLHLVFRFLDLNPISEEESKEMIKQKRAFDQSGLKKTTGPMWDITRRILDQFYKSYNEELADFLGDKKYLWNE